MEKEKELKRMTIESPAYVLNATTKLTKVQHLAKLKDWNGGKNRTEKRLPAYLKTDFYIPKFEEMNYEAVMLLRQINE